MDLDKLKEESPLLTGDFEKLLAAGTDEQIVEAYRKCKGQQEMYMRAASQYKAAYDIIRKQLDERKAEHSGIISGFSNEFKGKFNSALEFYDDLRNIRGKFRLKREIDFEVIALMDLFLIAFDQLQADNK